MGFPSGLSSKENTFTNGDMGWSLRSGEDPCLDKSQSATTSEPELRGQVPTTDAPTRTHCSPVLWEGSPSCLQLESPHAAMSPAQSKTDKYNLNKPTENYGQDLNRPIFEENVPMGSTTGKRRSNTINYQEAQIWHLGWLQNVKEVLARMEKNQNSHKVLVGCKQVQLLENCLAIPQ